MSHHSTASTQAAIASAVAIAHEDPLRARGLRRLLLRDLRLLERLLEQLLGPHELEREHGQADRDQHERRPGRDQHHHAADEDRGADDAEPDAVEAAAVAVRGPSRLELLDQLGARAPLALHRATVCQTVLKGRQASPSLARMTDDAIVVEGLEKSYGSVRALSGIDFAARTGSVLGLLGPNGAGKTTAVRILTTLLEADAGTARVAGLDVKRDAAALRAQIGLAGQYAAVDENLTGFENLEMVGRLYHLGKDLSHAARRRAARALRAHRRGQAAGQDVLRRHAPPARPRGRARRPAAGAVPRRADHRARPAQPDRHVGDDRGPRGGVARPCCSPPSTSTRPTGSPTRSW